MKSDLNLKYDTEEKKLYLLEDNKKIFVYLKTDNNNTFLVPISKKFKPIKFYNYNGGIKIAENIYDNILKKTKEYPMIIQKNNDYYIGNKKINVNDLENFKYSQMGGKRSKLNDLLKSKKISDIANSQKLKKRQKAIDKSKNIDKYLYSKGGEKDKLNIVNYKIYTLSNVYISSDDYAKIKNILIKSIMKRISQKFFDNKDPENLKDQIEIEFSELKKIEVPIKQLGGSNLSPENNNNYEKKGLQLGSNYFLVKIKGPYNYVNENIFNEKTTINLNSGNFNNGKPLKFFVSYVRGSKLQELYEDWDNSNTDSGKVVDRYVGDEQSDKRKRRFSRSVNYLKNITERLRDCTDISVAYQKKHKEVESMIITIRKLYGLILFLRDQITRNQDNYDTLERLILEIMIAMKQDYHIPEGELERLKLVQKRIADDGVELEKKFRIVSNQILDRLKMSDALKDESPDHIGPDFPIKPDLKFEDKEGEVLEQSKKKVKAEDYLVGSEYNDKDESDFTQYFKKKENKYGVNQSTGEPLIEDPDPFKYTNPDFDKGHYGKFRRGDEANNQLETDDADIKEYNNKLESVHDKASKKLKEDIKISNKKFLNNEMKTTAKKYKEQLGSDFEVELKKESDDDTGKLLTGLTITRKDKQKQDNKKLTKSMGDSSEDISQSGGKRYSKKLSRKKKITDLVNKYKNTLKSKKRNDYLNRKNMIDNYKKLISKNKLF